MSATPPASTLPRRANGIRTLAAQMATKKLNEINARQAVSDRIGYAVAAIIGAVASEYFGTAGIAIVVGVYAVSGVLAYRRYRALTGT
jgi:uncharacterized membrane protein (DUF4010 family)